jgi:hypothetical protein
MRKKRMSDNIEVFPLTITIPQSFNFTSIVEIVDSYASMRAIFVERDSIHDIPDIWRNSCGFYILFSRIKADGSYSVYVGKSDRDFTRRLRQHDLNKDVWATALLMQRNSIENLSSTHSSFLEGALRDIFDEAAHVKCHNIAPTGDRTLPVHERLLMKQVVESTLRIMLIRGFRTGLPVKSGSLTPPVASESVLAAPPQITMSVPSVTPITPETVATHQPLPSIEELSTPTAEQPSLPVSEPEKKPSMFSLFRRQESTTAPPEGLPNMKEKPHDPEEVFQALRAWRLQKAREERLSPAYIFDDRVLRAVAEQMPENFEQLLSVPGIKHVKREKYGSGLLEILDKYRLRALT